MGTLTTRPSGWQVLKTTADVAGTPDTSHLATPTVSYGIDAGKAAGFDVLRNNAGGKNAFANTVEIIASFSDASDADGKVATLEIYGSNDSGPRMPIADIAYTGGKAEVVPGTDLVTWCDTATVISYHSKTITKTDDAADRIVRISFDLTGFRYIEGLWVDAGATATTAIAYIRSY